MLRLLLILPLYLPQAAGDPAPRQPTRIVAPPGAGQVLLALTSGEWIRGVLRAMTDGSIEFDSDKMGELSVDWGDVVQLDTAEEFEFLLRSDERIHGVGTLRDGSVTVVIADGTARVVPRNDVLAIYPGGSGFREGYRYGKVSLGLSETSGNTQDQSFDFLLRMIQSSGAFQHRMTAESNYGSTSGEETEKRHQLELGSQLDLSRWFYFVLMRGDYTFDRFQNLDARIRVGAGPGVTFFRGTDLNWRFEAVPTYTYNKYRDVEPGNSDTDEIPQLLLSSWTSGELTKDIELVVVLDAFLGIEDLSESTFSARVEFSYEIIDDLTLDLSLIFDRVESPVRGEDNVLPERDDIKWVFGIGYKF